MYKFNWGGNYYINVKGGFMKNEKILNLIKKYGYLALLGIGVLGLILVIVFTSVPANKNEVTEPVDANVITFGLPVLDATIVKNFNDEKLQFNETLKQYEVHLGMDFAAVANSDVYAVLDGTITEIYNDYLEGTVMVITHANNFKSVYGSLDENVTLKVGDEVKKGDVIGKVSSSAGAELNTGNHLHFELLENDVEVDPAGYLNITDK